MTPSPISGVYELCIGTPDPLEDLLYWRQYGYELGALGELDAAQAEGLYGVRSPLRSLRLNHQDADHGLIRLMRWDEPVNEGLGVTGLRALGTRWGAMLTENILDIVNHAEDAAAQGLPIRTTPMIRQQIYAAAGGRPFVDPAPCVREIIMLQPHARQVMFQRFGYSIPHYGRVNLGSHFKSSQITHFGLVMHTDDAALDFYEEILGLLRVRRDSEATYEKVADGPNVFELEPGERYLCTDFDEPGSSLNPFHAKSGRLKIIHYDKEANVPDRRHLARPGSLGPSLYTYRVADLDNYYERVKTSKASHLTDVSHNEFGERSFSFTAPDGYAWTLLT